MYLASRGHVVLNIPALSSCAPIWRWWATSHMLNGSQQPCSICSVSVWGWICIFRANKCTSDRGGWNSSPQINQIQCNNPAILEVWRETPDLNSDLHFKLLWSRQRGNLQKHLDPVAKQAEQRSTFPSKAPLPKTPSTQPPFPLQPPPSSVYHRISNTQSNMKGWVLARAFLDFVEMWHLWKHLACHSCCCSSKSAERNRLMSLL